MKRIIYICLAGLLAVFLAACQAPEETGTAVGEEAGPEETETDTEDTQAQSWILVAYAPSDQEEGRNPVEYAAEAIAQTVSGTLYKIGDGPVEDFPSIETVILGFDDSGNGLPEAVETFLNDHDFGAKAIIPFVINGENSVSQRTADISGLQPGALVQDNGLAIPADGIEENKDTITRWAGSLNLGQENREPEAGEGNTVANGVVDPSRRQTFYLWEEGNMPAVTEYTENNGNYADDPDFRPTVRTFPVAEGVPVKGAVLICAGGAFQYRSDQYEGTPVAEALSERGYQSFVVDYRLRPYTQEEGALDLARAVRFVRSHADDYGIDEEDIAVMGFSAGGILSGEMLLNFDGTVNGTALDDSYVPDDLDQVSADAAACGMIYSFYGRLSVASTDVEKFRGSDLPPTYFAYGTRDPFVGEFEECIQALKEAGVFVQSQVLEGMPHGFGAQGGWIDAYDEWLSQIMA